MKFIYVLPFIILSVYCVDYNLREMKCLVCKATIEEMVKEINKVNPKKKIQVGGYKIDETGKAQKTVIPYARSAMFISELMDSVCSKMENFARATDKQTKKLRLIKLIMDNNSMNPEMSEVDIIQDSDLNSSLGFYCEGIVEEFESEIYNELKEIKDDPVNNICIESTKLCADFKDEL